MRILYCLLIVFYSVPLFSQNKILADQLLPEVLQLYKPGISYEEYLKIPGTAEAKKEVSLMSFRYEVDIILNTEEIEDVVLYFDKETKHPLYEYIIRYKSEEARDAFTKKNYGNPNQGKQWSWTLGKGKGPVVNAWTFESTLVIAIVYPKTEWDSN